MDVGLIFGIIFASILIGFLMFFGIKYIGEMQDMSCRSQLGQQIDSLKTSTKYVLSLSMGSSQSFTFMVPGCAKKVCFVNADSPEENKELDWDPQTVERMLVVNEKYNVLIYNPDGSISGHKLDKLRPLVNFCIRKTEDIRLKNIGTLVELSPPA
jgi:hypothetical protein